jgi:putative transposase
LSCGDVRAEPLEPTGVPVGIDLGVASFFATSGGAHVPNPRYLAAASERLAAAQRSLARKKRGGSRRKKAVAKVARLHGKLGRQRLDHAHKTALALVRDYDLIVHEDLQIANMTARPKPRPDGSGGHQPNGTAAKSGLNKSIHDAGWGIFLRVLSAKAESAGRHMIAVDPVTPPSGAPNAAIQQLGTASPRRSSDVLAAVTRPTPTSTPPGTFCGQGLPFRKHKAT